MDPAHQGLAQDPQPAGHSIRGEGFPLEARAVYTHYLTLPDFRARGIGSALPVRYQAGG